jgi:hypothetical protein
VEKALLAQMGMQVEGVFDRDRREKLAHIGHPGDEELVHAA